MQKSATNRQVSSIGSMPWWVSAGSQDEHIDSTNLNQFDWVGEHQKSQHIMSGIPEKEKEAAFHLAFCAGNFLDSNFFELNSCVYVSYILGLISFTTMSCIGYVKSSIWR